MKIKIYYQTISPESAENGDFESMGEWDNINCDKNASIEEIIQLIEGYGYLEPSSSQFHKNIWYSTINPEVNYKTGTEKYYTIHFDLFPESKQNEIYNKIRGN